jgi:GMP synthase (glutamine-hydrolysing)
MKPVLIIQNCQIESAGTVADYLSEHQILFDTIHNWRGDKIPDSTGYSAVISLGCPESVNDTGSHEFLKHLFSHVAATVRQDRPYLGICAGAQMLARVLGAKVETNPVKEIGTFPVRLTAEGQADPLFAGLPAEFPAFHWHGQTFKIPFGAAHLAESDKCKNQAFRKGKAVGLQFHLEARSGDVPDWCKAYASELVEVGVPASAVIEAAEATANQVRQHGFRLLDNFFAMI